MHEVLVTGAAGQLGSTLKWISDGNTNHFDFTDFEELDITNADDVSSFLNKYKPKVVINCAAYTAVDKAESEPEKARLLNADAVRNLVNACRSIDAFFFHISTDYVFDGTGHRPYREDDTPLPASVYGQTKLEGELEALRYEKSMVIRTSWLYSPFGNNFVKTMLKLGAERESLGVVADQVGSPTSATNLSYFLVLLSVYFISNPEEFKGGIYHFANEGVCSWYDFAIKIMEFGKRSCLVYPIETKDYPTPAKRPHYSVLNKTKIRASYPNIDFDEKNFSSSYYFPHWEESLRACINVILLNEEN